MSSEKHISPDGLAFLRLFPPFVRLDLVEDDAFRRRLGVSVREVISLNGGEVNFVRSKFFDAMRGLYERADCNSEVEDNEGRSWTLAAEEQNGQGIFRLSEGDSSFLIHGFSGLNPNTDDRISQFNSVLSNAGLRPSALSEWREIVTMRPLEDDEVRRLDDALMRTPISNGHALDAELRGFTCNIETMVPPHREYYEHLCGSGVARSVEELASVVVPMLVADLIAWDIQKGARMALLLASHASIIPGSGLSELNSSELGELAKWAVSEGDLIAKVGMIELGLAVLPRVPDLVEPIQTLVEQVRDLDASDPHGRLNLLMAAFVFVSGELSRTKTLEDWPPFRRRFAALAQASLFERHAFGHLKAQDYCKWALEQRGSLYYLQALVDLREEPRWLPDYGSAEQLGHELRGRIHNASGRFTGNVPEGSLRNLLMGNEPDGLSASLQFPESMFPGPLEGATLGSSNSMPLEIDQILNESLATEPFEPKSVIALINLRGLFNIGSEKLERAIKLIRDANHRFSANLEAEERNTLVSGLAGVASTMRNPGLADELRIMVRKARVDNLDPQPPRIELFTALTAAAANENLEEWLKFIGDWAMELAMTVNEKEQAGNLLQELETLCVIEPALRKSIGRAITAVNSYLNI